MLKTQMSNVYNVHNVSVRGVIWLEYDTMQCISSFFIDKYGLIFCIKLENTV